MHRGPDATGSRRPVIALFEHLDVFEDFHPYRYYRSRSDRRRPSSTQPIPRPFSATATGRGMIESSDLPTRSAICRRI
jgi:hypothetical protein